MKGRRRGSAATFPVHSMLWLNASVKSGTRRNRQVPPPRQPLPCLRSETCVRAEQRQRGIVTPGGHIRAPVDAARRSSYLNLLRVAPGGRRRTTTDAAHRPPNGTPQEQLNSL